MVGQMADHQSRGPNTVTISTSHSIDHGKYILDGLFATIGIHIECISKNKSLKTPGRKVAFKCTVGLGFARGDFTMDLSRFFADLRLNKRILIDLAFAPVATYFLIKTARSYFKLQAPRDKIHRAPLPSTQRKLVATHPHPYPPDSLEGTRDISTPYGNIRAYEWGPETGRKVLFIHGISTPCIALAGLAQALVEQEGCRVMLFDLFGRGYSDSPDTTSCPQDAKLWTTQISLVLGSSELDWWTSGCTMVGYSLGGGIAADFASWFPEVVDGLVLIAPAGLLRKERVAWWSKLVYGGVMPTSVTERVVRRRLMGTSSQQQPEKTSVGVLQSAEAEIPDEAADSERPLFPGRPRFSVADAVNWQVDAHPGFVPAFISSIQNSPIGDQQHRWRLIGSRLDQQSANPDDQAASRKGMQEGQVLLLLGKEDSIIVAEEVAADAEAALGRDNLKTQILDGGHDLPIANAVGCATAIVDFWSS
ncbi:hypothetical protein Q7P37_006764 [Cladosporium fusiforme]